MTPPWLAKLRRLSKAVGAPFALPTGSDEDGTWYELRPDGIRRVGVANPERFGDRAEAEEAAGLLLRRHPDFGYVEILSYEVRDGRRSPSTPVGRV